MFLSYSLLVLESVGTQNAYMYMTIFSRTGLIICLYGVVFRGEFDGDVQKCVAPLKKQFLSILSSFIDIF